LSKLLNKTHQTQMAINRLKGWW